jgi:hypothetical protein
MVPVTELGGEKMTCAGTPPAQARMIVLQATWAELEGGPGEHHRRAGRAPTAGHLRLGGSRQRRGPRGRIAPATRVALRAWLGELPGAEGALRRRDAPAGGLWSRSSRWPVSSSTRKGIYRSATRDSLVAGNTSDHDLDAGIYVANGATANEIRGNVTFANAHQYTRPLLASTSAAASRSTAT